MRLHACFCAPVALASAKGGATHRRFGKYYFWLMAGMAATGSKRFNPRKDAARA